jgi:hypothetical protein
MLTYDSGEWVSKDQTMDGWMGWMDKRLIGLVRGLVRYVLDQRIISRTRLSMIFVHLCVRALPCIQPTTTG